ncbi:MAG: hypothetical protein ACPHT8_14990, partial [Limisphaerales bacterium]
VNSFSVFSLTFTYSKKGKITHHHLEVKHLIVSIIMTPHGGSAYQTMLKVHVLRGLPIRIPPSGLSTQKSTNDHSP